MLYLLGTVEWVPLGYSQELKPFLSTGSNHVEENMLHRACPGF